MKKIILVLSLCFFVSFLRAENNLFLVSKNSLLPKTNTIQQPTRVVCWISEIIHHSDGTTTVYYRCKEICENCGYAVSEKKMQLNPKI
jgi:hypothetical protein